MKKKVIVLASVVLVVALFATSYAAFRPRSERTEAIPAERGTFRVTVSAGGTVEPENKISINAPIEGRIDQIVFEEGARVKRGQVIAWMSSTDRAALLDSARVAGGGDMGEWADVYKPTPILAPTDGEIIARKIVVGQTVNLQTVLFELSDHLIVTADVDETDLGKVHVGQAAEVTVDSFPGLVVKTHVGRIARQSINKNSINTYEVLLVPDELPKDYRAGLTATIQFLLSENNQATLLPTWVAEGRENVKTKLTVRNPNGDEEEREVTFGLSNGEDIEVKAGLRPGEVVLAKAPKVKDDKPAPSAFSLGGGAKK